ncbi:AAA family ATPase [Pilimelia columellifera]|uniref:ATPase AAA n=1 Tax=Pilimelia columellifera subsp. columellifera TaxID=706583 RepID=A0ABP6AC08_9ACTN
MTEPTHTPAQDLHTELTAERDHLAASRAALHAMRMRAEQMYAAGHTVAGDPFAAEMLGIALARRVAELADSQTTPLFFGRLDLDGATVADDTGAEHGEVVRGRFYVGRRHVSDDAGEPMVLDWRAPLSRTFYRASASARLGVTTRRRFGFNDGRLTSFEDERLSLGQELGSASRLLTEEIERPRVGPMRDIVATIQPEQDELVRAPLEVSICVQGAPGTGKTAVGLHRAAFLLYLHRERLRRSGVLIVGPNSAFLGYIAAVLPALGELEVAQSTIDEVIARGPARGADGATSQVIKHDARMAEVLRRALWAKVTRPEGPIQVSDGSYRWRVDAGVLARIVDDVRREGLPYALGRDRVRARVVALLQLQAESRAGESPTEAWQRRMGRSKPVAEFLDGCWPAATPERLLWELLSDARRLAAAAGGLLTDAEQAALVWAKPARTPRSARWSAADMVLLDELAGLIERPASLGHVILDEAQDLSPMQCRAIARRTPHGSVTVLGDLAQGTSPWAAADWADTMAHLGKPDAGIVPLTTGFRVPHVVVELANRLLPFLGVNVPGGVSLRHDGELTITAVDDLTTAVVAEVRRAGQQPGSIGVIAPDALAAGLRDALTAAGETPGVEVGGPLAVVPATVAKGLEYDHVVVVEPAVIVGAEERGLHRLYVVLTRAVSRLSILHTEPLPVALTV